MHVLALDLAPSPLQVKGCLLLPAIDFVAFDWIFLNLDGHASTLKAERRFPQARARCTVPTHLLLL